MDFFPDALTLEHNTNQLARLLTVYDTQDQNGPLKLQRIGRLNDGGYIVAQKSFEKADALVGYGIADDSSFEDEFSETFKKNSYGFDCGIKESPSKSKYFTFIDECIGSDAFIWGNESSQKISSFAKQIAKLNLQDKALFIKMDIEGAEYDTMPDILAHQAQITGIVLEIHADHEGTIEKAGQLLVELRKNFVLIHVHGNNCSLLHFKSKHINGEMPSVFEASFIHKNLVTNIEVAQDQSHPKAVDSPNCKLPDVQFTLRRS